MEQKPQRAGEVAFIVGCPRSGTNWTWGIVKAHPRTVPLMPADVGKNLPGPETGLFMHFKNAEILSFVHRKQEAHPGQLVFEKTPYHALHLFRIWKVFPEARVVFVKRDARATINSMLLNGVAHGKRCAWTIDKCLTIYGVTMASWRAHCNDERLLTVRYERLTEDPEAEVARIYAHLGLEGHVAEAVAQNHRRPAFDEKGVLRRGEVDTWREELPPGQARMIERVFPDECVDTGPGSLQAVG